MKELYLVFSFQGFQLRFYFVEPGCAPGRWLGNAMLLGYMDQDQDQAQSRLINY
ncbi:MAG: hypothetical protein R6U19_01795 [Bacteroidales bacterium]